MKLTIKKNGETVIEGSPEELAEYQRLSTPIIPVVVGPSQPSRIPWNQPYPNPYIGDPIPYNPWTITWSVNQTNSSGTDGLTVS